MSIGWVILVLAAALWPVTGYSQAPLLSDAERLNELVGVETVTLWAVPQPDLSRTETSVQDALIGARRSLLARLRRGEVAGRELGQAFGELGQMYHAHFVYGPAEPCYRNAEVLAPEVFHWPYYLGYLYQQTSRPALAVESLQRALRIRPEYSAAKLRLAQVYLELNEPDLAEPLFREVQEVPGLAGAALAGLGRIALTQRNYAEAIPFFEAALDLDPNATKLHVPLAMAYRAQGDLASARLHLGQRGVGELQIEDPLVAELDMLMTGARTHYFRALNAIANGRFEEGAQAFRAALELDPENVKARVSYARALFLIGDREGARAQLEEALRRDPDYWLAHFLLGVMLDEEGNLTQAVRHYKQTLVQDPEHGGAHYYLANYLMRQGEYQQAAAHYEKTVKHTPENLPARRLEALAMYRAGVPDRDVVERLRTSLEANPHEPLFMGPLARLLATSDDPDIHDSSRALTLASSLYEQAPLPENAATVAMALAAQERFEEAVMMQNQALASAMMLGRFDLMPALQKNLERYQAQQPAAEPWGKEDRIFQPPPTDASAPFRNYPNPTAY